MPRAHRDTFAGVFHVYAHSVWAAEQLFRDDVDRVAFQRELARTTAKIEWTCVAYCPMGSHYHLIVAVEDGMLPRGMHALNFRYALQFNGRHRMKGHVFAARYDSRRLVSNEHLLTAYRYVVNNPVEALFCDVAEAWPWSSYAETIGLREPSTFVDAARILDCFDGARDLRIAQLRRFVRDT